MQKSRKLPEAMRKFCFKKGQSGNPAGPGKGWKSAHVQLREALQKAKEENNFDPFMHYIKMAKRNPSVLCALMNKLVPNKVQVGIGPDDLTDIINSVVEIVGKYVKDNATREAIAAEIEALDFDEA